MPLLLGAPELPEPPAGNRMAGWYPWTYATAFFNTNVRQHGVDFVDGVYYRARLGVIACSLVLLIALYAWTRSLHGRVGGLLALALAAFDPNLLAHGALATVDVPATLFFFLAVGLMALALVRPERRIIIGAGLAFGAALATKFSGLLLLPVGAGLVVARLLEEDRHARRALLRRLARGAGAVLLVALVVVNVSYAFSGTGRLLGSYQFRSQLLSLVPTGWLGWVPLPLPADFVRGFDYQQTDVETGDFPNYLNGEWSRDGWWYYYPLALAVKTPVPTLLLILAGGALAVVRRLEARYGSSAMREALPVRGAARGPSEEERWRRLSAWATALGVGVPLFAACFLNRLDIGVRYILPIVPFLFMGAGSLGRLLHRREGIAAGLIGAGVLATALSGLLSAPHHLAYFNFLAGGREHGWTVLSNSNNDWGQDLRALKTRARAPGCQHGASRLFRACRSGRLRHRLHRAAARRQRRRRRSPRAASRDAARVPAGAVRHLGQSAGRDPYQVVDHGRWVPAGTVLTEPQRLFAWFRDLDPVAVIGGSIVLYHVEDPLT